MPYTHSTCARTQQQQNIKQQTNNRSKQQTHSQQTTERTNEVDKGCARYFFVSWSPGPLFFCSFFLLFLLLFSSLSIKMISDDKNQQGIGVIQEQMKEASATKCRSNKWTNEQSGQVRSSIG